MSRKVTAFAAVITNPLNIHNFVCTIPGLPNQKAMIIESTTFPTEKFREIKLWFQGEPVIYPTLPETDNKWRFKIPEADSATISRDLQAIKKAMYNQKTGILIPGKFQDIEVTARDLAGNHVFSVILHGAWLKGRDAVNLANNNPSESWKWDYEWVYDWIEDKELPPNTGINPYA